MISDRLFTVVRCPECASPLVPADRSALRCSRCGRAFDGSSGYADLRPASAFAEQTKYLDESLHKDARHESVSPPVLGSKIRNDMLRHDLRLGPEDRVLDLGCGSGRALIWNASSGAAMTGVDISPFFSREALGECDLVLGDLRRLPLKDGVFSKAWSLDVFEHLSPQALREVLAEAHRVLADDGQLFVYTHVRKNGWVAGGVRLVNRFAHFCERVGLIDLRQERLRKSDHLNPLRDYEDLRRLLDDCHFELERITYYTPVVGAFVENVLVRMGERFMTRKLAGNGSASNGTDPARVARSTAKARIRQRGGLYVSLRALTAVMKIDLLLFGRIQSGPFFAVLRKKGPGPQAAGPGRASEALGPRPEAQGPASEARGPRPQA